MVEISSITPSSGGGSQQFNISTFPFTWVQFFEAGNGTADTQGHYSMGGASIASGTLRQFCRATFADTTGVKSYSSNSKAILHMRRDSGTITNVNDGTVTSLSDNLGGGQYGLTINFAASVNNFSIGIMFGD